MATPKTILLRNVDTAFLKEGVAASAITPGDIVQRTSSGTIQRGTTANAVGSDLVALENDLNGGTIDTAYASGDTVRMAYPVPGDEIYALVATNAAAIVIGDRVVLDGAGGVKKAANILAGTLTGTVDGTLADIADIALSTGDSYSDSAVNTAVNAAILDANLQLKELQTQINTLATTAPIFGIALEAVDNSSNGDTRARIRIEKA